MKNNLASDNKRNLSILVSRYGLSFLLDNQEENQKKFFEYQFESDNPYQIENKLKEIFQERPILTQSFNKIKIIHHNHLNTLVPKEFFDVNHPEEFLKFNIKLFEFDKAHFDNFPNQNFVNVYIPFANINNLLLDYNNEIEFFHSSSLFINKTNEYRKNKDLLSLFDVYLNIFPKDFQMLIYKNEEIIFLNSFEYVTQDDFLYFFFFVLETLKIPEENVTYQISGTHPKDFELITDLKDFINEWKFLSPTNPGKLNNFIP